MDQMTMCNVKVVEKIHRELSPTLLHSVIVSLSSLFWFPAAAAAAVLSVTRPSSLYLTYRVFGLVKAQQLLG